MALDAVVHFKNSYSVVSGQFLLVLYQFNTSSDI
jgi:hypothetical protein